MNGYISFYNGKRREDYANSLLEARDKAAKAFGVKPNKAYQVTTILAERDGKPVMQYAADLPGA